MNPHVTTAITLTPIIIAVTLGYGVACWIWPFKPCRRCTGTGKRRSPTGRALRLCRPCRGTGLRLRAGRWLYNQAASVHRDGQ